MAQYESGNYLLAMNGTLYIAHLQPSEVFSVFKECVRNHIPLSYLDLDADSGAVNDPRTFAINTTYQGLLDALAAVVNAQNGLGS